MQCNLVLQLIPMCICHVTCFFNLPSFFISYCHTGISLNWSYNVKPETEVTLWHLVCDLARSLTSGSAPQRLASSHRTTLMMTDCVKDFDRFTKWLFASEGTTSCLLWSHSVWDAPLRHGIQLSIVATVHIVALEKYVTQDRQFGSRKNQGQLLCSRKVWIFVFLNIQRNVL